MINLSPREKKALITITSVMFIGLIVKLVRPHFIDPGVYNYSRQDSLFKALSQQWDTVKAKKEAPREKLSKHKQQLSENGSKELTEAIDVNNAPQKELEKLPRIGPVTAKNIIDYRNKNGPFKKEDDLLKVKRIGPKTLKQIEPFIVFGNDSTSIPVIEKLPGYHLKKKAR